MGCGDTPQIFFKIRKHKVRKVPLGRMGKKKKLPSLCQEKKRRGRAVGGKGSEMQVV